MLNNSFAILKHIIKERIKDTKPTYIKAEVKTITVSITIIITFFLVLIPFSLRSVWDISESIGVLTVLLVGIYWN